MCQHRYDLLINLYQKLYIEIIFVVSELYFDSKILDDNATLLSLFR